MNEFQERVGVGTVNYALGRTGPTRQREVIADDGPRRGTVTAIQTDHKSGRVDAHVLPSKLDPRPHYTYSLSTKEYTRVDT